MARNKTWEDKLPNLVRGGLKNANDAHPKINNYNGCFSSVEKRLTNNLKAFIQTVLKEHGVDSYPLSSESDS
jgi:hypothetical protein